MTDAITKAPSGSPNSFLNCPLALDLDNLDADIAILGVPFGLPYVVSDLANDQITRPMPFVKMHKMLVGRSPAHFTISIGILAGLFWIINP